MLILVSDERHVAEFHFPTVLKRVKYGKRPVELFTSPDSALAFVEHVDVVPMPLMLDTCAVLDIFRKKGPTQLRDLVGIATLQHSCVVLGELARPFGVLSPSHPETARNLKPIREFLDEIRPYRVIDLDAELLSIASIRAGVLARHLGLSKEFHAKCVNDAIIAAQAAKFGVSLVTANRRDFDLLAQLDPNLRVLFYRHTTLI